MCSCKDIVSRLKRTLKARALPCNTEVVTFSRLDYWTMRDLFDRLPLHDLIRLNGLVIWWSGYADNVYRFRSSLTVLFGDKSERTITGDETQGKFDLLQVTTIDSHTSDRLGRLLPNITSLEIIMGESRVFTVADVIHLIGQWSHQLVNLKLKFYSHSVLTDGRDPYRENRLAINGLFLSLNHLTTLKRLWIDCKRQYGSGRSVLDDAIDLSILSQLKFFNFNSGNDDYLRLRHSFVRYAGPNDSLKQIELPSFAYVRGISRHDFTQEERQVLAKIINIKVELPGWYTPSQWELFPNLTTVSAGRVQRRCIFDELMTGMQRLKNIRQLKMFLSIGPFFEEKPEEYDDDDLPQLFHLSQHPSVTIFTLRLAICSSYKLYQSFKSLQIGLKMFPNVKSFHLEYDNQSWPKPSGVVKLMVKLKRKYFHRMIDRRVRQQFTGVECTFNDLL